MSEQQAPTTVVSNLQQLRVLAGEIFAAHNCQETTPEPSIIESPNLR